MYARIQRLLYLSTHYTASILLSTKPQTQRIFQRHLQLLDKYQNRVSVVKHVVSVLNMFMYVVDNNE